MEVLTIAGASGVVGRHLIDQALRDGKQIRILTRGIRELGRGVTQYVWDPARAAARERDAPKAIIEALEGSQTVVNLAGASFAEGRLNADLKARILQSRLDSTRALGLALRECAAPPKTWIQASAVGYYGDSGDSDIDETASGGSLFLSSVCEQWEAEARAQAGSTRLAIVRLGLVLASDAPVWPRLVGLVRHGWIRKLGSGRQWWAWVDADDAARAILFLAERDSSHGVYNVTAPEPARQKDVLGAIASTLHRPSFVRIPAWALRLGAGEAADNLLLPSCRALPNRLREEGFCFQRKSVDQEVQALVAVPKPADPVGSP